MIRVKFSVFLGKRLIFFLPVLFGVSFLSWLISDISGDPITAYVGDPLFITEEEFQALEREYGLDKPWFERFLIHFSKFMLGDWGTTGGMLGEQPVLGLIGHLFPATIELAIFSMIIALLIGIPLGIVSAMKRNTRLETIVRGLYLSGYSIPLFVLAMIVSYLLFQVTFEVALSLNDRSLIGSIPYSGRYNERLFRYPNSILFGVFSSTGILLIDSILSLNFLLFFDAFFRILSPGIVVAIPQVAIISRMTRMAMIETMKSDYILLARAKGLKERTIIYRHALKNAIIPTLTVSSIILANLLTGILFVEIVFHWPGLGTFIYVAVNNVDMPAIQGFIMITTLVYMSVNFIVDLIYGYIDPRIRGILS